MRRLVSGSMILALAACGPKAGAPSVTADDVPDAFRPPARYAAMFEPGRQWQYRVSTTTEYASDSVGPVGDVEFSPLQLMGAQVVICTVAEAGVYRGSATSRIVCEVDGKAPAEAHPVAGAWTADPRGLSRDGVLVLAPDGAECSDGNAQQLCFADGGVLRGWFNAGSTSSTFEIAADGAVAPAR